MDQILSRNHELDPSMMHLGVGRSSICDGGTNQSLENSLAGISEIQAPAMLLKDVGGGWDS